MGLSPEELRRRDLERKRQAYAKDPQKFKARARRWRELNSDKHRQASAQWRQSNPDGFRKWAASKRPQVEPGHVCPVCGTNQPGPKGWVWDHDHRFSRYDPNGLRGVLCQGCNTGGKLTDSIPLLLAKAEYLRKHTELIDALLAGREAA